MKSKIKSRQGLKLESRIKWRMEVLQRLKQRFLCIPLFWEMYHHRLIVVRTRKDVNGIEWRYENNKYLDSTSLIDNKVAGWSLNRLLDDTGMKIPESEEMTLEWKY
jgi:hypothetical protein